jgi:hypothetical protein
MIIITVNVHRGKQGGVTRVPALVRSVCVVVSAGFVALGSVFAPLTAEADDAVVAGPVKEGERLDARSDEYSRVFDRAVNCLIEKNAGCFRALLSSFTVTQETRGPGAVDAIIQDRFIPYFSDFSKLSDRVATVPSYDAAGNSGLAICRSFITNDGREKFFVLYVNLENGRYVVGNLLLDTKVEQVLAMKAGRK